MIFKYLVILLSQIRISATCTKLSKSYNFLTKSEKRVKINMKMNLKQYLSQTKSDLRLHPDVNYRGTTLSLSSSIVLCLGNEAADADSIISSVCYGYLKQQLQFLYKNNNSTIDPMNNHQYVPIVSIERNEMNLRPDVNILLKAIGLELNDLICIDEIPMNIWNANNLAFTLLDHNAISSEVLSRLPCKFQIDKELCSVIDILDHHTDNNIHLNSCNGPSRQIAFDSLAGQATVASTCTLIVEQLLYPFLFPTATISIYSNLTNVNYNIDDDNNTNPIESSSSSITAADCIDKLSISVLLMGVIALDSLNMDPVAGRGTCRDQRALDTLETIITSDPNNNNNNTKNSDGRSGKSKTMTTMINDNNNNSDDDYKKGTAVTQTNTAAPPPSDNNAFLKSSSTTTVTMDPSHHHNHMQYPGRIELYERLKNAKMDAVFWASLSAYDALRLDYKAFEAAGSSSSSRSGTNNDDNTSFNNVTSHKKSISRNNDHDTSSSGSSSSSSSSNNNNNNNSSMNDNRNSNTITNRLSLPCSNIAITTPTRDDDNKRRTLIGISSVLLPIESLLDKPDIVGTIVQRYFTTSNNGASNKSDNDNNDNPTLDLLVIMSVVSNTSNNNNNGDVNNSNDDNSKGSIRRQLLLCCQSRSKLKDIMHYLIQYNNHMLGLSTSETITTNINNTNDNTNKVDEGNNDKNNNSVIIHTVSDKNDKHGNGLHYMTDVYEQANIKMSRKQLAPLLINYYTSNNNNS